MWFSKGEEAYTLTSNDFLLLTSIQSLCSLSLYAPMCTHMSTHICAHTDMRAHIVAQLVKNRPAVQETRVRSLGWEDPWKRKWQPTPVSLLGKFLGRRSLVCYSPWSCKEWDTTKRLYFHFFTFFHFTHTCPSGNHLFVLCMRLFSFCFLNSTYK